METVRQRKSHRKSRHGCSQCKERRIKCDEQKPKCGQCSQKSLNCSLELITPASYKIWNQKESQDNGACESKGSGKAIVLDHAQSMPSHLSPFPPGYTQKDLKLFHHFLSVTSLTLTGHHPQLRVIAKATIGQLACSNDSLMRNVLSLAAIHIARPKLEDNSDLLNTALGLQNSALVPFRRELESIDKYNCHALFASCIVLNCFMCALLPIYLHYSPHGKYVGLEKKPPASVHQSLMRWMRVLHGTSPVTSASWEWLSTGPLSPFVQYPELEGLARWATLPDMTELQPKCLVQLDAYWKMQLGLGQIPVDEGLICLEALAKLRAIYAVLGLSQRVSTPETDDPEHGFDRCSETQRTDIALAWYVLVPDRFITLVDEGNPHALSLLAYSGALLIGSSNWWSEDLGKTIIRAVAYLLQSEHGDYYDALLQWPLEQVSLLSGSLAW